MASSSYTVSFQTTKGTFSVRIHHDWSPHGADRLRELVEAGHYDDVAFFRVLDGFVAQFGISGDPKESGAWRSRSIPDDPVKGTNTRGTLSYAMAGPGTRTTQLFINLADNTRLDGMGFAPVGEVIDGMDVVDSLHSEYGEGLPRGNGPDQGLIQERGNAYLKESFPLLDFVEKAVVQ